MRFLLLASCALASQLLLPSLAHADETRLVHIDAPDPVPLEWKESGFWSKVCDAPCDAKLPIRMEYRVTGDAIRTSAPFNILTMPGDAVTLRVHPASRASFVGGITLLSVGGMTAFIGLLVTSLELHPFELDADPDRDKVKPPDRDATAGYVTIGVGLGIAVIGGLMLAMNTSTSVDRSSGIASDDARAPLRARIPAAAPREPTWHRDPIEPRVPRASLLRVVDVRF